jgi:hypothetical protein
MNKEIDINILLGDIEKQKENSVDKLVSLLRSTNDFCIGNKIAFTLVDHFKDDRIESCLIDLIRDPRWKGYNGTLLYLLGEYTNNSQYLYFLIDMILKNEKINDGETFMGAYSMIINLHPPLDKKDIIRSIQRVKREEKKKNISKDQRKLIHSLLNYLEGQRDITQYYKQFEYNQ